MLSSSERSDNFTPFTYISLTVRPLILKLPFSREILGRNGSTSAAGFPLAISVPLRLVVYPTALFVVLEAMTVTSSNSQVLCAYKE